MTASCSIHALPPSRVAKEIVERHGTEGHRREIDRLATVIARLNPYEVPRGLTGGQLIEMHTAEAIRKYSANGTFEELRFFEEVFAPDIDPWGFVMCYYPLIATSRVPYRMRKKFAKFMWDSCLAPSNAARPMNKARIAGFLRS